MMALFRPDRSGLAKAKHENKQGNRAACRARLRHEMEENAHNRRDFSPSLNES
jgi:hypothetical protein